MNPADIEQIKNVSVPITILNKAGTFSGSWNYVINNMDFVPDFAVLTSITSITDIQAENDPLKTPSKMCYVIRCTDFGTEPLCPLNCITSTVNMAITIPIKKHIQSLNFQLMQVSEIGTFVPYITASPTTTTVLPNFPYPYTIVGPNVVYKTITDDITIPWYANLTFDFVKLKSKK